MTALLLGLLVAVGLASAGVLAVGGRRGREASNPWWFILAGVSMLLTVHVLGFYLPGVAWFPWAGLGVTLIGAVPAGLRERDLWLQEFIQAPKDRDRYVDIALFFVAVLLARAVQPSLPDVKTMALVLLAFIPLVLARWAATRMRR